MMDAFTQFAAACTGNRIFGLPTWYEFLTCRTDAVGRQLPQIVGIADIWLIVAAIIDILLRIAGIAAIIFVLYGGVQYLISQGDPDRTAQARRTIINAIIGLVIAIAATALITFIAGSIH